jgi:hypothetical protein
MQERHRRKRGETCHKYSIQLEFVITKGKGKREKGKGKREKGKGNTLCTYVISIF